MSQEDGTEQIGRIIGARLRAAAKAKGWTQGQVHYQVNAGQDDEIVSMATVSALLRGAIASPSVPVTWAVARALGLTLDQAVGITPLPETTILQPEDDLAERVARLESTVLELLEGQAAEEESAAEALERAHEDEPPAPGAGSQPRSRRKAR